MIPQIEEHRTELEEFCRKYYVGRLEVFGSAVDGSFDPGRSDLDFLVEFHQVADVNPADQYFGLFEDLQALFDRKIDLVCAKAMRNPYFIRAVNASRKLLYAA